MRRSLPKIETGGNKKLQARIACTKAGYGKNNRKVGEEGSVCGSGPGMPARRRCGRDAEKPENCTQWPGFILGAEGKSAHIGELSQGSSECGPGSATQGVWESGGNSDPQTFPVFTVAPMHWVWEPIGTKSARDTGTHP